MLKKIIIVFVILSAVIVISVEAAFMLVPSDLVQEHLAAAIERNSDFRMIGGSPGKVFPLGFELRGVSLAGNDDASLYIERCSARFAPFFLLKGRLGIKVGCSLYGGKVNGFITRGWHDLYADLKMQGIDMSEFGRAVKSGIDFPGAAGGAVSIRTPYRGCPEGFVRVRGKGDAATGEKKFFYRGFYIPMGRIDVYGADIKFSGCRADVKGLWVKGETLSARVSGTVRLSKQVQGSALDLTFEFVPAGSLAKELGRMIYLRPYRKSATFYTAAIKGTLGSPLILPR